MYEITAGAGKHQILLRVWRSGQGCIGSLTGGEEPHVGGVILAVPRPSLTGSGLSCDIWSIPVPGHLDNEAALSLAKQLCVKVEAPVSLTSGIHIDKAGAADIARIKSNCESALAELMSQMTQEPQP